MPTHRIGQQSLAVPRNAGEVAHFNRLPIFGCLAGCVSALTAANIGNDQSGSSTLYAASHQLCDRLGLGVDPFGTINALIGWMANADCLFHDVLQVFNVINQNDLKETALICLNRVSGQTLRLEGPQPALLIFAPELALFHLALPGYWSGGLSRRPLRLIRWNRRLVLSHIVVADAHRAMAWKFVASGLFKISSAVRWCD